MIIYFKIKKKNKINPTFILRSSCSNHKKIKTDQIIDK